MPPLACALLLGDELMIYQQSRWFVKRFPYATQSYRLYSFTNRLYTGPRTWYNSGPSQKYILRQIKAMDFAILDAAGRKAYKFTEQEVAGWTESGKNDGNPHGITELDPALLALYAHVLATGGRVSERAELLFPRLCAGARGCHDQFEHCDVLCAACAEAAERE